MNYNERDLRTKIEAVVNTELFNLTKLVRKQFSHLTNEKMVKFDLDDYSAFSQMTITTKSIIIDTGFRYICIDTKCNKFDIASFDLPLVRMAGLVKTLAIIIDVMANDVKKAKYLDNDFSDYHSEKQLMIELAFNAAKRDSLLLYYLNYDLIIKNTTGYLEITKHKTRESDDAGELVLLVNSGLCFLKKSLETTLISNLILGSQASCNQ